MYPYQRSKFFIICFLIFGLASTLKAQTYDEFFRQKKTQQKYLIQQLLALKVYAGYLQQGYTLVKDGLQTVNDLKNGVFHLQETFLSSHKSVNPKVIQALNSSGILLRYPALRRELNAINLHSAFSSMIRKNLLQALNDDQKAIQQLLTTGALEMNDAERLKRLNASLLSFQIHCTDAHEFLVQLRLLQKQKAQELESIQQLQKSYEIHP